MGRSGPCSFKGGGFPGLASPVYGGGQDAHPGEAAEGKRQAVVAVAWVVGRGQRAARADQAREAKSEAGPRAEAVSPSALP